jgi:hypothetical protein
LFQEILAKVKKVLVGKSESFKGLPLLEFTKSIAKASYYCRDFRLEISAL